MTHQNEKTPKEYLKELLHFTQSHTDIAIRIQTLYPPTFSLLRGEHADFEAWQKGYALFLKAVDAIHDQAAYLAELDSVSKSLMVEIELIYGEYIPKNESIHDRFPKPIICKILAAKFNYLEHIILNLMHQSEKAIDLANTNPVLLWLVALKVKSRALSTTDAISLMKCSEGMVLFELFPESQRLSLRLLKRVIPVDFNVAEVTALKKALGCNVTIPPLYRCKRINLQTLSRLHITPFSIGIPLVLKAIEFGQDADECDQLNALVNCVLENSYISISGTQEEITRCDTYEKFYDLIERCNKCEEVGPLLWDHEYASIEFDLLCMMSIKRLREVGPFCWTTEQRF